MRSDGPELATFQSEQKDLDLSVTVHVLYPVLNEVPTSHT